MMTDGELRWRCRRGMKELDQLLLAYVDKHYSAAPDQERQSFERLLALPDPVLWGYFSGRETPPDTEFAAIIDKIIVNP